MAVLTLSELDLSPLRALLAGVGLRLEYLPPDAGIPSSYWGAPEAGIRRDRIYARPDTPLHSVLHTAGHYACMDPERRAVLDRDCGGDDTEEVAVCYLQCLWARELPGCALERMWADMDEWGYSFRLGSARRWFEDDAEDARAWLESRQMRYRFLLQQTASADDGPAQSGRA